MAVAFLVQRQSGEPIEHLIVGIPQLVPGHDNRVFGVKGFPLAESQVYFLVIAHDGRRIRVVHEEAHHIQGVGASIHQVTDRQDLVFGLSLAGFEECSELVPASVDVADDKGAVRQWQILFALVTRNPILPGIAPYAVCSERKALQVPRRTVFDSHSDLDLRSTTQIARTSICRGLHEDFSSSSSSAGTVGFEFQAGKPFLEWETCL